MAKKKMSLRDKRIAEWFVQLAKSYDKKSRRVVNGYSSHIRAIGICTMIDCSGYAFDKQKVFERVTRDRQRRPLPPSWPWFWGSKNFKSRAAACRKVAKYVRERGTV